LASVVSRDERLFFGGGRLEVGILYLLFQYHRGDTRIRESA
jgi:hypothetical protein